MTSASPGTALRPTPSRRDAALLLLAVAPLFVGLGAGLHGSEGRWTFVAQEMLSSGNWLEPRIMGEFYGDKPLFSYWLIALLAAPFGGVGETLARLPSALAAAGTVWITARCARRFWDGRRALLAGFVLACSFSLVFWAHLASDNLVSLFCVTAAIAVYLEAREAFRPGMPALFFVLIALGGQSKGMPGIAVPLAVAGADMCLGRRIGLLLRHRVAWISGAALGALFYLAPFVASRLVRGDWDLAHLMWVEKFVRAFDAFDHRENVFYYIYTLPLMLLPWGLSLPGTHAVRAMRASALLCSPSR